MKNNIFATPNLPLTEELFEPILTTSGLLIERIVSMGQITPPNEWYNQDNDEWVMLVQGNARLLFDHDKGETLNLIAGDYVLIPKNRKHRVVYTSFEPPCIWLAIHGNLQPPK